MNHNPTSSRPVRCRDCHHPMDSPVYCATCGALNPLPPGGFTCFELFGLEAAYDLDLQALHRKYLSLSRSIHPDVAGRTSEEARARSLALSAELNQAYDTLRDPVERAEYLLSLTGEPVGANRRSVPGDLLAEVMMLREQIEEARTAHDPQALAQLQGQIADRRSQTLKQIGRLCRALHDPDVTARQQTRAYLREQLNVIRYWNNLREQIPAETNEP